jgi:transcription antitermination factor NusG
MENIAKRSAYDWYAIYTRHQHEKAIAKSLSSGGIEVFVPTYDTVRQWKDRKKSLSLPLFPSYVFLRHRPEQHLKVVSTPGVHFIVSVAGRPAPIPEVEIIAIQKAVKNCSGVQPHPFLRCGDRVRVKSGSLDGVEGILIRTKSGHRLILSAQLLERSISVEVDMSSVERIERAVQPALVSDQRAVAAYATM